MPIFQKPKDVLQTTDVPRKYLTFLSHTLGQEEEINYTQSFQTSMYK